MNEAMNNAINTATEQVAGFAYPLTAIITLLAIAIYFVLTFNVGRARAKFGIQAPATDGPADFQRVYRVHMNMVEQLMMFLPLLWLTAVIAEDHVAATIGLIWSFGRIIYAIGYYRDASKRMPGFLIGLLSTASLFVLVAWNLAEQLL
jgi:glutathione S-transferase